VGPGKLGTEGNGGDVSPPNIVGLLAVLEGSSLGAVEEGSMSRDDRNELGSRSSRVLIVARKVSWRFVCSTRGVPLRSSIFWKFENEESPTSSR